MEASWSYDATELRLGLPGNQAVDEQSHKRALMEDNNNNNNNESKVQVVGWPPVRSHRINIAQKRKPEKDEEDDISSTAMYVKVSMDGAPYLRKIDLKVYKDYKDLRYNLEDMFTSFLLGEYVITYEDKDGDWMMVGDVPWEMFISICKRLRIMKGSEARGLGSSL